MDEGFYIPRTLLHEDKKFSEEALLGSGSVIVILAEPGAGKTELLSSLARRLQVRRIKASIFHHQNKVLQSDSLVLDALDEVAKQDPSGIDSIFVRAQETGAARVVFASRSSEWEEARNIQIRECFGSDPTVVRLQSFNVTEQEELFSHHFPEGTFAAFRSEIERFDLEPLLGNPQFLLLFAEAFFEGGEAFTSKRKIFEDAVRRLAYVAVNGLPQKTGPTAESIVLWANEVFAKLLLSGAVGVCVSDTLSDRQFPRITSLLSGDPNVASILDTRLFKPSDDTNLHEPVHRIVAEYGAAQHLAKRIDDSTDPLSLRQLMAVIAPNLVVREELRGLLGWMAAVGGQALQEFAIDLDPYAVLANGDPSQLFSSSKRKLLVGLQRVEANDPYFRRGDSWRTFSASGFFTAEVIDDVRPLLTDSQNDGHLIGLLLELLEGSVAVASLSAELQALMLDPRRSPNTRKLAHRCLITASGYDHVADCKKLIIEGSQDALSIAAGMFQELGASVIGRQTLLDLLNRCTELYPGREKRRERVIGGRYFVKQLVRTLDLPVVEWLLDQLTNDLTCTCGEEKAYNCHCRNGISKVVGILLDRYFDQCAGPFDPARIWKWVGNLNYHNDISADQSTAVHVLQTNDNLRQSIQSQVLEGVTEPEVVNNARLFSFGFQAHAGLHFQPNDSWAMVDLAFRKDNPGLWSSFVATHNVTRQKPGPDRLRRHMRDQARQKPSFMKVWAKRNRDWERMLEEHTVRSFRHSRKVKRRKKRRAAIHEANLRHLRENRTLIKRGQHWGWISRFAELYLMKPEKLSDEVDDAALPETALRNCLPFIEPELPTLHRLAEMQCGSQSHSTEFVLYAACLAIFRDEGSLESVNRETLAKLKTNIDVGYSGIESEEREAFEKEVDRLLFTSASDVEAFARTYIEPQLRIAECRHTNVGWLRYKDVFEPLRGFLPFEWLSKYEMVSYDTLDTLFELSVRYADRKELQELIKLRCYKFLLFWPDKTESEDLENRREFWFLRHFFFVDDGPVAIWHWLSSDANAIFALENRAGRMNWGESDGWPNLDASKTLKVLDAFVEKWPKVDLPNHWGTGSPKEETAYRFLTDSIWAIDNDDPENCLPALERILKDTRFKEFHKAAQNLRARSLRKKALRDFEAPSPNEIVSLLDRNVLATVEGMRALLLEELEDLQRGIKGSEFDPVEKFYDGEKRVDEPTASKRIAEHLQLRLNALNTAVTIEHHMKSEKRCDITASNMFDGNRRLLVIEVKGQWHAELFTAASEQLYERYSIHPDAEQQGIYLVLWFGRGETIAGKKDASVSSPSQLRDKVIDSIPEQLRGLIDVFVLDLSDAQSGS